MDERREKPLIEKHSSNLNETTEIYIHRRHISLQLLIDYHHYKFSEALLIYVHSVCRVLLLEYRIFIEIIVTNVLLIFYLMTGIIKLDLHHDTSHNFNLFKNTHP